MTIKRLYYTEEDEIQGENMSTLKQDIAALADDESVMWAVGVLTDKGINGVMYDKLISFNATPERNDDGNRPSTR